MANKKKKLTTNQQAFKKEQQRLKRAQKRLEKKGYYFTENLIPDMPKRVTTKALEEIKSITTAHLKRHSVWVDPSTGELKGSGTDLTIFYRRRTQEKLRRAGQRKENIQRLLKASLKRAGITPAPFAEIEMEFIKQYIELAKQTMLRYDDNVIDEWEEFWNDLENSYTPEEIADALEGADGVPEPDGKYNAQQSKAFKNFKNAMLRKLPKRENVDIKQRLNNIDTAIENNQYYDEGLVE
jgi:hypothetical protein